MFTGIVEELGRVEGFEHSRLRIGAHLVLEDVHLGDSIAVNGCCLTVVAMGDGWWEADVSQETLDRTSLLGIRTGSPLNLERSVKLQDRLGGLGTAKSGLHAYCGKTMESATHLPLGPEAED